MDALYFGMTFRHRLHGNPCGLDAFEKWNGAGTFASV
jgi:hypothetical protein